MNIYLGGFKHINKIKVTDKITKNLMHQVLHGICTCDMLFCPTLRFKNAPRTQQSLSLFVELQICIPQLQYFWLFTHMIVVLAQCKENLSLSQADPYC